MSEDAHTLIKEFSFITFLNNNQIDVLRGQESKIVFNITETRNGHFTIFSTSFDTTIKKAPTAIYKRHVNPKGTSKGNAGHQGKGNLPGEHLGVFISIKIWLKPYIRDFKQLGPRIIVLRLATRAFEMAFLSILAPHSGKSDDERKLFYDTLNRTLQELPPNCRLRPAGDWNANLHFRFPAEEHIIGPHYIGRGEPYLLQKRREGQGTLNRDNLVEFCEKQSLVIANTCHEHGQQHLFTYKKPTTPFFAHPLDPRSILNP